MIKHVNELRLGDVIVWIHGQPAAYAFNPDFCGEIFCRPVVKSLQVVPPYGEIAVTVTVGSDNPDLVEEYTAQFKELDLFELDVHKLGYADPAKPLGGRGLSGVADLAKKLEDLTTKVDVLWESKKQDALDSAKILHH